jgi:2-oxo-3-hexenedioate decarboxylase
LTTCEIDLFRDGALIDHGHVTNVLGGPLAALRYLIDVLDHDALNPPLAAGEIVTTGTLTRAFPVAPGQSWGTSLTCTPLTGVSVRFT